MFQYEYKFHLYSQLKGGAIGILLTGEVARLLMDRWSQELRTSLSRSSVELYLLGKYIDNVDIAAGLIEEGME